MQAIQSYSSPFQAAVSLKQQSETPAFQQPSHTSVLTMSSYSMSLALVLLMAAASHVQAQTALSAWTPGVATNYGGVSEGDDPNTATYGLSSVSQQCLCVSCIPSMIRASIGSTLNAPFADLHYSFQHHACCVIAACTPQNVPG